MQAISSFACTRRLAICSKFLLCRQISQCLSSRHNPCVIRADEYSSRLQHCRISMQKYSSYSGGRSKYTLRKNTEALNPNSHHKTGKSFVEDAIQYEKGVIDEVCNSIDLTRTEFDNTYWQTLIDDKLGAHPRLVKFWPTLIMSALAHRSPNCPKYVTVGESVVKYYATSAATNIGLLISFALLCARHGGPSMHGRVSQIYDQILQVTDVLDSTSAGLLIEAFSLTARWHHCFQLLEMASLSCKPNVAMYSAITVAALKAGNMDVVNDMFRRFEAGHFVAEDRVFLAMIEHDSGSGEQVTDMLERLSSHGWIPSENVAVTCKRWFDKKSEERWQTAFAEVDTRGLCRVCRQRLMPLRTITRQEFEVLQTAFMDKSLLKGDIFQNTTPEEVLRFHDFIQQNAPFDVILDALNLYHAMSKKATFEFRMHLIKSVIDYFAHCYPEKKLLVVGRQHMTRWPPSILQYIDSKATTFYAEDISADDPFMTYAALHSGRDALVVTKDELRDHRFLLGWKLAADFKRWQRSHQVVFLQIITNKQGYLQPLFKWPNQHETVVQSSNYGWHIPYEDGTERASYELPKTWLCVTRKD